MSVLDICSTILTFRVRETMPSHQPDPLASLLSVSVIGGVKAVDSKAADFELIVEHGYTISKYELIINFYFKLIQYPFGVK